MELTCKRGTLVLSLIAVSLFFGFVYADDFIYATCTIKPLGYPGMNISGEIQLRESTSKKITNIKGHLFGFTNATKRGFHVHENGSIDNNCSAAGLHYNPFNKTHGGPADVERHVGDLGNIGVEGNLESHFEIGDTMISLHGNYSILNRTLVVHVGEDDLGKGGYNDSLTTGHSGYRIGCCIITWAPNGSAWDQPTTTGSPQSTPAGTVTSTEPCGFLLLLMAGLLLSVKCIQH